LIQFGPIVHQLYLKSEKAKKEDKTQILALVNQFCSAYYDTKLIFMSDEPEKELLEESIMKEEYSFT
jgi:hypothetical protein